MNVALRKLWLPACLALGLAIAGCDGVTMPLAGGTTDTGDSTADDATGARSITGSIDTPASAKWAPRAQDSPFSYGVIVQAAETGQTYRAQTDAAGDFQVDIPASETGETFVVTLVNPDGQPAGPVIFGTSGTDGLTGLAVTGDTSLGTIDFPSDPNEAAIVPGTDADVDSTDVAADLVARLNDRGVPVGVPGFGRGQDAELDGTDTSSQPVDADQDGMIDIVDADDDGDGTVDDFDDDAELNPGGRDGVIVNFFMNLKIDDVQATPYFSGDVSGIEASLKNDTVITFEVGADTMLTKNITGVRVIAPPAPAPPYLPLTTVDVGAPNTLWSTLGYALRPDGTNHFQEWVVPHASMNTGDMFTVEVTFDDGTTGVYSRMINYVFKSIPKLINVGPPGALAPFNGPAEIVFDGTQDLVFEWAPPVDDFGNLMVGLEYFFEVFFYDGADQQIDGIDASTWATPITNWHADNQNYEIAGTSLVTLSAANTFTVQMPKEIFVDTVQTASGAVAVESYKVDIAAQKNGNNAALMLRLRKQ